MRFFTIALTTAALSLGATVPGLTDHHETAGHGEAQAEAGMPPMGPPPEMEQLAAMNGEYDVAFWYKMDPMSEEWTETQATAVISTVLGGAAQQMRFEGEMMGMPFSGIGLTTFDRETQMWQTTWVDTMSARLSMYTGEPMEDKMVVTGKDMGQGMTFHSRLTNYNMTEKGFDWKYEMSMDGTNYMETAKATYRKK